MSSKKNRNRCRCGSGKKSRHCCGAEEFLRDESAVRFEAELIPAEVLRQWAEHRRREHERIQRYGHVRPLISVQQQGYQFVATGNTLHFSKNWKTFHDFLGDYIKQVLGSEWGNGEIRKPFAGRHPILQWYHHVCLHQQQTIVEPGEVHEVVATGPDVAYLSLAYDLYTLEHHALLRQQLVKRLKVKAQFQGARYETYVAAAFVRAGFDIALEDETDSTQSHCEFVATHKQTTATYSVEAKSRHRPGFLGTSGKPQVSSAIEADVYRLMQKALMKKADHPRIVMVDVNVPPHAGSIFDAWGRAVAEQLKKLEDTQNPANPWPPAFLFFTNHPYHYVEVKAPDPGHSVLLTAINTSDFKEPDDGVSGEEYSKRISVKYPAVTQLYDSVLNHSQIPHELSHEPSR